MFVIHLNNKVKLLYIGFKIVCYFKATLFTISINGQYNYKLGTKTYKAFSIIIVSLPVPIFGQLVQNYYTGASL